MTPRKPSPRHKVTVEIGGEKHILRSDVPPEYTRAVAAHLDTTLRALPGFPSLEPHRAATLAALAITDELFRAREEIRFFREEAERRVAAAAELLEAAASPATDEGEEEDAGPVTQDVAPPAGDDGPADAVPPDDGAGETGPAAASSPSADAAASPRV